MTSLTTTLGGLPRALFLTRHDVESKAIMAQLEDVKALEHGQHTTYYQGIFASDEQQWRIGVAEVSAEGAIATKEVERAVSEFRPQCILFVGLAQGCQGVDIGDVAVASKLYGSVRQRRQDSGGRQNQSRPSDMMLQRVKEEAEGLAWLRHTDDELSEDTPKVVIAPIAAGHDALFSPDTLKLPLLPRPQDGTCAVTSETVGYYASTFSKHSKVLLIQGISSMIGDAESERNNQEKAMLYASAFAFQVLSQVVPLSTGPMVPVTAISPRYTFLAAVAALAFGVLASLPMFCVRQKPYVKEIGVQNWMVWLGPTRRTSPRERYWLVRTGGRNPQAVALLLLSSQSFEGFFQATPLYWDTRIRLTNRAAWSMEPWRREEPPVLLKPHPWVLLQRREDGSLTLHNLSTFVPRQGRALVYLTYQRKKVVGEISFAVGSQIVVQRKFWDWKTLQEGQGFLALRLISSSAPSPKALTKHEWPPVLTLQQERDQKRVLWRFLDKVPEVQLPGTKWVVLRPGKDTAKAEPLGLVQVEPGDEGWVKVLRMPWRDIEGYRHISVRYFDPQAPKSERPDWSRFGEIQNFCKADNAVLETFGACVLTNLGLNDNAQVGQWYWLQGESLFVQNKQTHRVRGFVRLQKVRSQDAYAQAFLLDNTKLRWRRLVKLTKPEREKKALRLCYSTLPDLRNLLRLPMQRLTRKRWQRRYQRFDESLLVAALLMDLSRLPLLEEPLPRTAIGRCLREGVRLQQGIRKKFMLSDWSQRWRDAQSMMQKHPEQALLLLRGLCSKAPQPESEAICNKALLRLHLTTQVRDFSDISDAWAKRLRSLLRHDPCFTVRQYTKSSKSEWLEVEEQLRTQDSIEYRPVYCRGLRARRRKPSVLLVSTPFQSKGLSRRDISLLGQRWADSLQQFLFRRWNANGLFGKPDVAILHALSYRIPPSRPTQKAFLQQNKASQRSDVVVFLSMVVKKSGLSLRYEVWAANPKVEVRRRWVLQANASGQLSLKRWNVFALESTTAFAGLLSLLHQCQMGVAVLPSALAWKKPGTRVFARELPTTRRPLIRRKLGLRRARPRPVLPRRDLPRSRPTSRPLLRRMWKPLVATNPPKHRAVPPRKRPKSRPTPIPTTRPLLKKSSTLTIPTFREIRTTPNQRPSSAPTTKPAP